MLGKNPVTKRPHVAKQLAGRHKWVTNVVTNRPNFASGKGGHDVTEHFGEGGCYVRSDKPSTLKAGWTKNTWTDRIGSKLSQQTVCRMDGLSDGRLVWVEMSRGWFVGGWIVKAQKISVCYTQLSNILTILVCNK